MLARDRYGVDVILEPSRFLVELPAEVYERWTIEVDTSPEDGESASEDAQGTGNGPATPETIH
jgi:hypothetical protein